MSVIVSLVLFLSIQYSVCLSAMLPKHTPLNLRTFSQSQKTSFQMPIVEKSPMPATYSVSSSWEFNEDHPLVCCHVARPCFHTPFPFFQALFLSMFLLLLVTYVLDRRTRHGIGRRNRPLFHLLLCTHAIAAILIFYNYIKQ